MSDYRFLEDVVKIKKLSRAIERVENKASEESCPEKKLEKLQRQKNKYLAEIDLLKTRYIENVSSMNENNQAVCAFVLFRSMEGVERVKHAFRAGRLQRCWFSLFWCCTSEKRKSRFFNRKWLVLEEAVEPELLLWENFGVSSSSRFFRVIFYFLFVILMLVVCTYIISYLETASNDAQNQIFGF